MRTLLPAAVLLITTAFAAAAPSYRVTDLHTQDAYWLTSNGTVFTILDHANGTQTYSAIRNGQWSNVALPTGSYITDISDNGNILASTGASNTFVQFPSGTRQKLSAAPGSEGGGMWYVNNSGTVAGIAYYGGVTSLVLWKNGKATFSHTAVQDVRGFSNDGTALLRMTNNKPGTSQAIAKNGVTTRLPGPTQLQSTGADINDHGMVAGEIYDQANQLSYAAIWTANSVKKIAPLKGQQVTEFSALNNSGYAVGHSAGPDISATLWDGKALTDLNARIVPTPGVRLEVAYDINDSGQILVQGTKNGHGDYFLLTPTTTAASATASLMAATPAELATVPEPAALGGLTGVAMLMLRRRRSC